MDGWEFLAGVVLGLWVGSFAVFGLSCWGFREMEAIVRRYDRMVCRLIEQRDRLLAERDAEGEDWKRA